MVTLFEENKNTKKLKSVSPNEPIEIIYRAAPQMINPENKFICKGKHQYREVEEEHKDGLTYVQWKCQCGKTV